MGRNMGGSCHRARVLRRRQHTGGLCRPPPTRLPTRRGGPSRRHAVAAGGVATHPDCSKLQGVAVWGCLAAHVPRSRELLT